jgi:peptidoglycan L-alanyl-D-glutamate endopeptidase CwlK
MEVGLVLARRGRAHSRPSEVPRRCQVIPSDIGSSRGRNTFRNLSSYKAVGALGTDLGLDWGGNWTSIVDQPHFQLRPAWSVKLAEKEMLAELRGRLAAGTPVFA